MKDRFINLRRFTRTHQAALVTTGPSVEASVIDCVALTPIERRAPEYLGKRGFQEVLVAGLDDIALLHRDEGRLSEASAAHEQACTLRVRIDAGDSDPNHKGLDERLVVFLKESTSRQHRAAGSRPANLRATPLRLVSSSAQ